MPKAAAVPAGIDARELRGLGWHHENQCYYEQPLPGIEPQTARQIHQALGHRLADVAACGQEPCRSLPLDAVLTTMSRR